MSPSGGRGAVDRRGCPDTQETEIKAKLETDTNCSFKIYTERLTLYICQQYQVKKCEDDTDLFFF